MKEPFDLERYVKGEQVVNGLDIKVDLISPLIDRLGQYLPLLAVYTTETGEPVIYLCDKKGRYVGNNRGLDLFMEGKPTEITKYLVVFKVQGMLRSTDPYDSEKEALNAMRCYTFSEYITTFTFELDTGAQDVCW